MLFWALIINPPYHFLISAQQKTEECSLKGHSSAFCKNQLTHHSIYFNSTSTSISQAIPPGSAFVPIAERAGRPASSPNSSAIRLDPPFTT